MHTVGYEIATYIMYADKLSFYPTEGYPYYIRMQSTGSPLFSIYLMYGQVVANGIS